MKKLLTGFLSLFLVLTLIPVSAGIFAEEAKTEEFTVYVKLEDDSVKAVKLDVVVGNNCSDDRKYCNLPYATLNELLKAKGYELVASEDDLLGNALACPNKESDKANPVNVKKLPAKQEEPITFITIKFMDGDKEVAGSFTISEKMSSGTLYDTLLPGNEKDGYKLVGWTIGDKTFAAGSTVQSRDLMPFIHDYDKTTGEATLIAKAVFEKIPAKLSEVTIKYLEDKAGSQKEVAAGSILTEDDFVFAAGSVYKKFEKAGYTLAGWKFGDKFFKAGEKIEFAKLAELVGDNFDKDGKAVIAFTPVFEKIPAPQKPVNPSQPVAPQGRPNVNTGVNF